MIVACARHHGAMLIHLDKPIEALLELYGPPVKFG